MAPDEFAKALASTDEIQLAVTGRASGRKISHPVWFVQDGGALYLLPVKGSDSEWYKNVRKDPTVTLAAKGVTFTAKVTPITDAARVQDIVEKFRAKYGAGEVQKYYSKFDVALKIPLARARGSNPVRTGGATRRAKSRRGVRRSTRSPRKRR